MEPSLRPEPVAKQAVITVVEAALSAWPECPSRMAVNESGQVDGSGDLYLLVQFPVANGARTTHSLSFVEEGAARILINAPSGSGIAESLAVGERIASLFRGKRIAGIQFGAPTSPLIHDDNDDGQYFKTSVVVPYVYHFDDPDEE